MRGSVEIRESEVLDPAFEQQLSHRDKEPHQLARIGCKDSIRIIAAHVFCGGFHRGCDDFARRICQELGEPFKDLLDLLGVGFSEVFDAKIDADVAYASCYLSIWL